MERQLGLVVQSFNERYPIWVREALDELDDSFLVTDPCISGNPIVFASSGFLKMFGYSKDEVIGKNGRVFQGPKTNRRAVMEIREAIRAERDLQISLINYRKDGRPFWMLFHLSPVYGKEDGKLIHFLAVQVPISRRLRRSSHEAVRDGINLYGGRSFLDSAFRCCRREVLTDGVVRNPVAVEYSTNSDSRELDVDEPCEASEQEKRKAAGTSNSVLSVLIHHSQLTGRLVCGKGCCLRGSALPCASLNFSLGRINQSFVLMDPHLLDMPIVYASDEFLRFTGYARHDVLGYNCRLLSGPDTDPAIEFLIKERIQAEQPCTVCILNYRNDKTPFWNLLHISPVRNATGRVMALTFCISCLSYLFHNR